MKLNRAGVMALVLMAGFLVTAQKCTPLKTEPEPPPPVVDIPDVDQAIRNAVLATDNTNIYTNVLNLSGRSCVEASTTRGQGITRSLQKMADDGELPGHTVKVYTYSGYRVPGIQYSSLHTYTVTQLYGPDGKPVSTWTSDDYLGPASTTQHEGSGGYDNWDDPQTSPVGTVKAPDDRQRGHDGGGGGGGD